MSVAAYPLKWPAGWPRTETSDVKHARFGKREHVAGRSFQQIRDLTVADSVARVRAELGHLGIGQEDIVISTNLPTTLSGNPRSDRTQPLDRGIAVYWVDPAGEERVLPIDRYSTVADNLAAAAATLEAFRAIERHGGARVLNRAFSGLALPPPAGALDWQTVMGFKVHSTHTNDEIRLRYKKLAAERHPDKPGGSHAAMAELNAAYEEAKAEMISE